MSSRRAATISISGQIEEKGLCKLWIIPEEKLRSEDSDAMEKEEAEPTAPRTEPAASEPAVAAPRGIDTAALVAKLKAIALGAAANGIPR